MQDMAGIERRLAAALARLAVEIDRATPAAAGGDSSRLSEALEAERAANAQLTERVRAIKDKQETMVSALEKKVARLSEQLEAASSELQRQKRVNVQLTETNRALAEAAERGVTEPHLLNRSMMSELESLRAARAAEVAEMNEILSELKPLLGEVA